MALHNLIDVCSQKTLVAGANRLDKGSNEPRVSAPVPSTLVLRAMTNGAPPTEVRYGIVDHVPDDLAMRKVHAQLAVAYQRRERDHRERRGAAVCKLHVHDLVVADVVIALVDALAVRAGLEGVGDVLDVWEPVDDGLGRPALVSARYGV